MNIMDMSLQQLQDAGIEISIQINTANSNPTRMQLRDALNLYAKTFGELAARKFIGDGSTLDDLPLTREYYQKIIAEIETSKQE